MPLADRVWVWVTMFIWVAVIWTTIANPPLDTGTGFPRQFVEGGGGR